MCNQCVSHHCWFTLLCWLSVSVKALLEKDLGYWCRFQLYNLAFPRSNLRADARKLVWASPGNSDAALRTLLDASDASPLSALIARLPLPAWYRPDTHLYHSSWFLNNVNLKSKVQFGTWTSGDQIVKESVENNTYVAVWFCRVRIKTMHMSLSNLTHQCRWNLAGQVWFQYVQCRATGAWVYPSREVRSSLVLGPTEWNILVTRKDDYWRVIAALEFFKFNSDIEFVECCVNCWIRLSLDASCRLFWYWPMNWEWLGALIRLLQNGRCIGLREELRWSRAVSKFLWKGVASVLLLNMVYLVNPV